MAGPSSGGISKRRFLRLAILGAAGSALVAACGPATPAAPTAAPAAATPKPAAPTSAPATSGAPAGGTSTPAAAATGQPAATRGGTFTYAEAGDFNNFNPWNFSAVNFEMYDQVFSRLLWKDGTGKANPDLAESWQLAPDNLSIKLKLRENAKWHDGKAVTAQDFVDMFGYTKDETLIKDASVKKIQGLMAPVKEVNAADKALLELKFSAPVPY